MKFQKFQQLVLERSAMKEFVLQGVLSKYALEVIRETKKPREARTFLKDSILRKDMSESWYLNGHGIDGRYWDELEVIDWKFDNKDKIHVRVRGIPSKSIKRTKDIRIKVLKPGTLIYHSSPLRKAKQIETMKRMIIPSHESEHTHGKLFGKAVYATPKFSQAMRWGSQAIVVLKVKRRLRLAHLGQGEEKDDFNNRTTPRTFLTKASETPVKALEKLGFDGFFIDSTDSYIGWTQYGIIDPNDLEVVKIIRGSASHLKNPTDIKQFRRFSSWVKNQRVKVLFTDRSFYVMDFHYTGAKHTLEDVLQDRGEKLVSDGSIEKMGRGPVLRFRSPTSSSVVNPFKKQLQKLGVILPTLL